MHRASHDVLPLRQAGNEVRITHSPTAKGRRRHPCLYKEGVDLLKQGSGCVHSDKIVGRIPPCQWDTSPLPRKAQPWERSHMPTHVALEIERRMNAAEMNAKQLARAAGLNETYVRDILKGRSRNPKHEQLAKLADALDATVNDLLPPQRVPMQRMRLEGVQHDAESKHIRPWTTAVVEVDVYAGMGGGGLADEQRALGVWQVPTEWLRQEVRGDLQNLNIITLEGDSMADTLSPGDKVIVDLNRRLPSPPGLFVVWDGMALVAKRLEYLGQAVPPVVRITSDNPRYAPYERTIEEVSIIGRIMGRWQRLS